MMQMEDCDSCWYITNNCDKVLSSPSDENAADETVELAKKPKVYRTQQVGKHEDSEHSVKNLLVS